MLFTDLMASARSARAHGRPDLARAIADVAEPVAPASIPYVTAGCPDCGAHRVLVFDSGHACALCGARR